MLPPVRKAMLTGHLISSVGWIGALMVFLAHALASRMSDDIQVARAAMIAMDLSAWFVILPLALASLATGIFQALGTPWGLLRHYWVLFKLALTVIATAVLLTKLGPIGELARAAMLSTFTLDGLSDLRNSMVLHAAGGLFVLLIVAALAVFKPAGRTRIGAEQDRRAEVPVWVKVSAWTMVALLVAIALMVAGGKHGPRLHGASHAAAVEGTVP